MGFFSPDFQNVGLKTQPQGVLLAQGTMGVFVCFAQIGVAKTSVPCKPASEHNRQETILFFTCLSVCVFQKPREVWIAGFLPRLR